MEFLTLKEQKVKCSIACSIDLKNISLYLLFLNCSREYHWDTFCHWLSGGSRRNFEGFPYRGAKIFWEPRPLLSRSKGNTVMQISYSAKLVAYGNTLLLLLLLLLLRCCRVSTRKKSRQQMIIFPKFVWLLWEKNLLVSLFCRIY